MLKKLLIIITICLPNLCSPDTIEHYMHIANQIPKMELKADSSSQAWAHSARDILELTSESILESFFIANQISTQNKHPIFCMPTHDTLSPKQLNDLIQDFVKNQPSVVNDNKNSVSRIALLALQKKYPCTHKITGHYTFGHNA